MKLITALTLLVLVAESPGRPEAAIPYFSSVREVRIVDPAQQNYFVVDEEIWNHARPDLADLRLYDGDAPVQYALTEQREAVASEEVQAKILNLGSVSGHTEFDLNAQGLTEYDRIRLRLDTHDFVASASVWGGDGPGKAAKVELPSSTLYDFTKEQLGSNSQLKLPRASFRFLHVRFSVGIRPQDVKGAAISYVREQQASWTSVGSCTPPQQKQHITSIVCNVPGRVPLSRVSFRIAPEQVNFRRTVSIEDPKGAQVSSGEISRVRVNRAGTLVTDEQLAIRIAENPGQLIIAVDNGDNPPLSIQSVQPLATERRVYFDPQGKSSLKLYYGDDKLSAPVFDYARFFHAETSAHQAELGSASHNPQYASRPDERPWSERHTVVLWAAMLIAVLALAFLAFRGLGTSDKR